MASSQTTQSGEKQKRSRHANLTMTEEIALCQAYVKITLDGNIGTNQSHATLWERITTLYHTLDGVSTIPVNSTTLQRKFATISTVVSLYVACLATVEHASGSSPADLIQNARRKFQQNNKNKAFPYDHAFDVLRVLPKYNPELTRRQSEITGEGSSEQRPPGRKGEKERQRMNSNNRRVQEAEATIESTNAFMRWHKEAHKQKEQRKLQFQQTWERQRKYEADTHILFMNTTHMTPTQLTMHSREVEHIIARRNAEAAAPPSAQPQSYSEPQDYSQPQGVTPINYSGQLVCSSYGNEDDDDEDDGGDDDEDLMHY